MDRSLRGFRPFKIRILSKTSGGLFALALCVSLPAWAQEKPLNPPPAPEEESLLDPGQTKEWRQRYQDYTRAGDERARYRLLNSIDQNQLDQSNTAFSFGYLQDVQTKAAQKILDRAMKNEGGKSALESGRAPVVVAGAAAVVALGVPVKLKTGEDSRIKLRSQAIQQKGHVAFESGSLETRLEVARVRTDPSTTSTLPLMGDERSKESAKVSMNKKVKELGMGTGVAYGATTNSVTTSISKSLSKQVELVLDSSRSPARKTEDTLSVHYNLLF